VIKVNDEVYIPVTSKNIKPITVDGTSYIPVKKAPEYVNKSKAVESPANQNGNVNTFKVANVTYIPLNAVPKKF
jgi:hypothetical protein